MTALKCEDGIIVKVDAITAIGDVQASRWSKPKAESNKEETGVKYYFWVYVGMKGYQTLKAESREAVQHLHNVVAKAVFG